MYLFIVTFIIFSVIYWKYGIKYLNYSLYLWKREAEIMTLQKYINYYEKNNGKVFFIVNRKCRCKKKFNNKVKCLKCRINNIINIESFNDWMKMLSCLKNYKNINLIIHSKGGDSNASDGCSKVLKNYQGNINVFIPEYAFSAGTVVALTGNNIFMNWYSFMGPVDAQMEYDFENEFSGSFSTKYIKGLKDQKGCDGDKEYLQSSLAEAYHKEAEEYLRLIIGDNQNVEQIVEKMLNTKYSHEYNFTKKELIDLQLPVKNCDVPSDIMQLFNMLQHIKH